MLDSPFSHGFTPFFRRGARAVYWQYMAPGSVGPSLILAFGPHTYAQDAQWWLGYSKSPSGVSPTLLIDTTSTHFGIDITGWQYPYIAPTGMLPTLLIDPRNSVYGVSQ